MEAACPLLRFVNYDEPKTKREKYTNRFWAKIELFWSKKVWKSAKNCSEIIFTTGKSKMKKIIFDEKSLYNEL